MVCGIAEKIFVERSRRVWKIFRSKEKILDVKVNLPKSSIDKVMEEVEQQTGIQIMDDRLTFIGYRKSQN